MSKSYGDKLLKKIYDYTTTNYCKINKKNQVLGEGLFNHKCHLNSVQNVKEGKANEVILCIVVDEWDRPTVHFINKKDDKYIDNTLGWLYEKYDYYRIRKVDASEFCKIECILTKTKRFLVNLYSKEWIRKILSITDDSLI